MDYRSVDSVVQTDDKSPLSYDVTEQSNPPGFLAHKLLLKVGAPVMLLQNQPGPNLQWHQAMNEGLPQEHH